MMSEPSPPAAWQQMELALTSSPGGSPAKTLATPETALALAAEMDSLAAGPGGLVAPLATLKKIAAIGERALTPAEEGERG